MTALFFIFVGLVVYHFIVDGILLNGVEEVEGIQ